MTMSCALCLEPGRPFSFGLLHTRSRTTSSSQRSQLHCICSVATKIFREIAQFQGPPPWLGGCRGPKGRGSRCEAARAAIRFGGLAGQDVLKCTIAPRFGRKQGAEPAPFPLSSPHPLRLLPTPQRSLPSLDCPLACQWAGHSSKLAPRLKFSPPPRTTPTSCEAASPHFSTSSGRCRIRPCWGGCAQGGRCARGEQVRLA